MSLPLSKSINIDNTKFPTELFITDCSSLLIIMYSLLNSYAIVVSTILACENIFGYYSEGICPSPLLY